MIANRWKWARMRASEAARSSSGGRGAPTLRPRRQTMAIEPRMLFDGAAAPTAEAVVVDKTPPATPDGGIATKTGGPGPSNHAPVANCDYRTIAESETIDDGAAIAGNDKGDWADSDADGDALHVTGVAAGWQNFVSGDALTQGAGQDIAGQYGTIHVDADGSYRYTPSQATRDALATGDKVYEVFSYTIADTHGATSNSYIKIYVTGEGDCAPRANADERHTLDDRTITDGQAIAGDAQGDTADEAGCNPPLQVVGVSSGTTARDDGVGVGTRVDGAWGSLVMQDDGSYRWTPSDASRALSNGQSAQDVYTYTVRNGAGEEAHTTLTIDIAGQDGANHAPVTNNDFRTIHESQSVTDGQAIAGDAYGDQADTDSDGDALHMVGVTPGFQGYVSGTPSTQGVGQDVLGTYGRLHAESDGSYTYVPFDSTRAALNEGDRVYDVFSYTVADTHGATANGTIKIYIDGESHGPIARDDARTILDTQRVTDGEALRGDAYGDQADSDADGSPIRVYGIVAGTVPAGPGGVGSPIAGQHGTLVIQSDGAYTYTPYDATRQLGTGETVQDVFNYKLYDDNGGIAHATITITVVGTDELVARPDARSTDQNTPVAGNAVTGTLPGEQADTDADGHPIEVVGVRAGTGGPAAGQVGAAVTGAYGTLTLGANGAYTYVPGDAARALAPGQHATDVYTYTITDGHGSTSTTTITIDIVGLNDAPLARPDVRTTDERTPITGNVVTGGAPGEQADSDVDGDALVVQGVRPGGGSTPAIGGVGTAVVGQWGSLTLNPDGSYTYTPSDAAHALHPGQTVQDVFTYTVNDGRGGTSTTTLTVNVQGLNDAPLANPDRNSIASNATAPATGNAVTGGSPGDQADTDADGDTLTVSDVRHSPDSTPASAGTPGTAITGTYGQLVLNPDGSYRYTVDRANPDVAGLPNGQVLTDTFRYTVRDGSGASASTTVTITIVGSAGGGAGGSPGGSSGGGTGPTEPLVIASGPSGITGTSSGASAGGGGPTPLTDVAPRPFADNTMVIPADPFGLVPPTRVAGFVEEAKDDGAGPLAEKSIPGTGAPGGADKLAAGPARKQAADRDDCVPVPKAKPRPVAVKRSTFAAPLAEPSKAFSEQVNAAKKHFKPPVKAVPPVRLDRSC